MMSKLTFIGVLALVFCLSSLPLAAQLLGQTGPELTREEMKSFVYIYQVAGPQIPLRAQEKGVSVSRMAQIHNKIFNIALQKRQGVSNSSITGATKKELALYKEFESRLNPIIQREMPN
jgi:hypothetical protein